MSPKRNIESLYGFIKAKLSQHIKNETSVDEGEGRSANENGVSNFMFSPDTFYFVPLPLSTVQDFKFVYKTEETVTTIFEHERPTFFRVVARLGRWGLS